MNIFCHVYMCTACMYCAFRSQKRVSSLGLWLQAVGSHHVGAVNKPVFLCKSIKHSQQLSHLSLVLNPPSFFFLFFLHSPLRQHSPGRPGALRPSFPNLCLYLSTQEADLRVPGQSGIHSETVSKTNKKQTKNFPTWRRENFVCQIIHVCNIQWVPSGLGEPQDLLLSFIG